MPPAFALSQDQTLRFFTTCATATHHNRRTAKAHAIGTQGDPTPNSQPKLSKPIIHTDMNDNPNNQAKPIRRRAASTPQNPTQRPSPAATHHQPTPQRAQQAAGRRQHIPSIPMKLSMNWATRRTRPPISAGHVVSSEALSRPRPGPCQRRGSSGSEQHQTPENNALRRLRTQPRRQCQANTADQPSYAPSAYDSQENCPGRISTQSNPLYQAASATRSFSSKPSRLAETCTVSPSRIAPSSSSPANGFCKLRWMTRFNGRAPYTGS